MMSRRWSVCALVAGVCAIVAHASAHVDLVWRPSYQEVFVGQPLTIRLYAVSDSDQDQSIGVISAIMSWNVDTMVLQGDATNGPYDWFSPGFPLDPDCLNCKWSDGDAFYRVWRQLNPLPPAWATPGGLLVTTMRFIALEEPGAAELGFLPEYGASSLTRVLDGLSPGLDVTGLIDSVATVTLLPCGSLADTDADCDVDHDDAETIRECVAGPGVEVVPACLRADRDGDGDVDLQEVALLQNSFTGP